MAEERAQACSKFSESNILFLADQKQSFAMANMTTLVASLYMRYETSIHPSFGGVSPAIISLFETFWDERYEEYKVSDYHPL